jgi:hypothetical protein
MEASRVRFPLAVVEISLKIGGTEIDLDPGAARSWPTLWGARKPRFRGLFL